jgi:hypothetical protein
LLVDELQHIPRLRDMRKIDLGLDTFFATVRASRFRGRLRLAGRFLKMSTYFFCFVLFQ